jgi:LysR family glycine cleavage system transcriptional activator
MRSLPPLNGVRAFEAAARHESFSRAAEELFVTPAAISQQVKALEGWLDVELFQRQPRGLLLTSAGKLYLSRLTDLLDRLADATEAVKNAGHTAVLTVSATPGFAAMWLGPRLWNFANAHPELDIRISTSVRPVDLVRDGMDVAIVYGPGGAPGLISELLMRDMVTPVCSPRLLEGPHPLREPKDLRHHVLLHNESPVVSSFRMDWEDWLQAAGVQGVATHRGLHFNDPTLVIQEAIAGRGVALGHTALIGEELKAGRLVQPFELMLVGRGDYYVIHQPGAEQLPNAAAFLAWLRTQVAQED